MINKFFLGLAALAILGYGGVAWTGTECGDSERDCVPADVRQPPGQGALALLEFVLELALEILLKAETKSLFSR